MSQPTPAHLQYNTLVSEIEKGTIKIPQFQREFVWSIEDSAKLLDSIIKGFPIGTFILWKTKESLRSVRDIGGLELPTTPDGDFVQYVLDGQQRMTSLYVSMKGAKIKNKNGKIVDYSEIYVDLEAVEDGQIVITNIENLNQGEFITFTELMTGGFALAADYPNYLKKLEKYVNAFKTYLFSTIHINEVSIDIATEIFTRINVGGKDLSVFEIMVAKTYDSIKEFDLAEKYEELLERLAIVNYETIPNSTVLQAVAVCLVGECSKKHILQLDKMKFISIWGKVVSALESAVEYFKNFYRIPVSQLLPYNGLLVPFTYYFYHHADKPLGTQQKYLQDYFWRTVLTSRFSNSLETKVGQDIKRIDLILKDTLPKYEHPVDITIETLQNNGWFSTSTAYIKGFLCLLAHHQPQSFIDNSLVNINNNWLKQANSKNYHHFFPYAYLEKKKVANFLINHIANITIVDDFLNKRQIRDKAPSKYIGAFSTQNPNLNDALKTHLIDEPSECGILNNDYDLFFQTRLQRYHDELKKRLILKPTDRY